VEKENTLDTNVITKETSSMVQESYISQEPYIIQDRLKPLLEEGEEIHGILPIPTKEDALLVFTELRVIYISLPEFHQKKRFYSYPYETVKSLMIKKRTSGFSQDNDTLWFLIDYTSEDIIFAEIFPPESIDSIKELMNKIPAFADIPMVTKVYSSKKWDAIANEPGLILNNRRKTNIAFVLIAILLIATLVVRRM
jgi:hypothetical protein